MNPKWKWFGMAAAGLAVIGAAAYLASHKGKSAPGAYPRAIPPGGLSNFELFDVEGHAHELYRYADHRAIVVFSFGADCPIVQKSVGTLKELARSYSNRGVAFLALDANAADNREVLRKEIAGYEFDWPVMRDTSQLVAKQLGFHRTGEVALIDTRSWKVVYRGAVDDRLDYGVNKQVAQNHFLRDAVDAVLAGSAPKVSESRGKGCAISFREDEHPLEYVHDIAPILKDRCVNCHSETGAIKPYFSSYEVVKSWAAMMRETVMTGRMPIWGIDSDPGEFLNDSSLSPEQKRRLITWIDEGALRGEGMDPLPGYVPEINNKPPSGAAYTAEMSEETIIPPEGFDEYHYYQLGGPLPRDMWVNYVMGETTNPRAMHHATVTVTPEPLSFYEERARYFRKAKSKNRDDGKVHPEEIWMGLAINSALEERVKSGVRTPNSPYREDEWIRFNAYSLHGRNNRKIIPKGAARFLPKGYYLILETHHEGTGRTEREKSKLHLYEIKKTPDIHPIHRIDAMGFDTVVPPYVKNYRVDLPDFKAPKDMVLLACTGHMHIRGRELQAWAHLPDGRTERVISIPAFDYTWHPGALSYFAKPRFFPAGTVIKSYAIIDNSATNPFNPDPSLTVPWGSTLSRSEMPKFQCIFHFAKD